MSNIVQSILQDDLNLVQIHSRTLAKRIGRYNQLFIALNHLDDDQHQGTTRRAGGMDTGLTLLPLGSPNLPFPRAQGSSSLTNRIDSLP